MLPFLKSKKDGADTGLIVKTRSPDKTQETDEDDPSAAKEACGQAIIAAIHSGSAKAVADAMQDMFELCDAEPHVEGEHISKHDYESQNIKAGQE